MLEEDARNLDRILKAYYTEAQAADGREDPNLRMVLTFQSGSFTVEIYGSNPGDDDFPTRLLSHAFEETPSSAFEYALCRMRKLGK